MGRFAAIAVITCLMAAVLTGCKKADEWSNESAITYLENKYGKDFEYAAPYGDSLSGTRKFLVRCRGVTDDKRILVQVDNFRSEDRVIKDSYLSVKYSTETEKYIKKHIDACFGESKVGTVNP